MTILITSSTAGQYGAKVPVYSAAMPIFIGSGGAGGAGAGAGAGAGLAQPATGNATRVKIKQKTPKIVNNLCFFTCSS